MGQHVLEIHCLYEFWFDLRLDSCQAASPRRCPERWLNLRFLLFPRLWSALFALVTDTINRAKEEHAVSEGYYYRIKR